MGLRKKKSSEKFLKKRDVKHIPIESVFEEIKELGIVDEMLPKKV
ncbi:MAG: hypothetical protein ACOCT9_02685 [archaeon]